MKTQHTIRRMRVAVLAVVLAAPINSVWALGPFQVRRATEASSVCSAPPVAVVSTSPYDGESMGTGVSYDYQVFDASGSAVAIAVQKNFVTQTLRISFDDGDAASSPVDGLQSSVTVEPASIV